MYCVYFIKSSKNHKVYVGFTGKEPHIRIEEHNSGGNQWSKHNGPFKLIYYETFSCKEDAILRESFFKTGIGKMIKKAIIEVMDS